MIIVRPCCKAKGEYKRYDAEGNPTNSVYIPHKKSCIYYRENNGNQGRM